MSSTLFYCFHLILLCFLLAFVVFSIGVISATFVLIFYYAPRYGRANVVVYIAICSLLGSFTVIGCKAIGVAIKETSEGEHNAFTFGLTWFFIIELAVCVAIQMNYLNRALDTFSMTVVTPIFYVFFTSSVIIGSAILFQEWTVMSGVDMVGTLCGFLVIVSGIYLLNAFKDLRIGNDFVASSTSHGPERDRDTLATPLLPVDDANSLSDASSLINVASPSSPESSKKYAVGQQASWNGTSIHTSGKTSTYRNEPVIS